MEAIFQKAYIFFVTFILSMFNKKYRYVHYPTRLDMDNKEVGVIQQKSVLSLESYGRLAKKIQRKHQIDGHL